METCDLNCITEFINSQNINIFLDIFPQCASSPVWQLPSGSTDQGTEINCLLYSIRSCTFLLRMFFFFNEPVLFILFFSCDAPSTPVILHENI